MKKTVIILLVLGLLAGLIFATGLGERLYWDLYFTLREPTEAEAKVLAFAQENHLSFGDYPGSLVELLERNPETEEFVLGYPLWQEQDYDLSQYRESREVPLFLQWDPRWGYTRYGSDVMGLTGCGPTSLAMAGYYLTGDEKFKPDAVAAFSEENGYYARGSGSSWTLISEGGPRLGLEVKELPLVKKKMVDSLEQSHPVILAMGPGDFTTTGHYIVLTGVEEGKFRVNDPNSRENSRKLWSYEQLEGQIRNIWSVSK